MVCSLAKVAAAAETKHQLREEMKIETRPMGETDFEFSHQIKKDVLGPYVAKQWGWDDDVQRRFHREHWQERDFLAIRVDGKDVGTVWVEQFPDHWRLGEFYILPEFQNRGIGSHVLAAGTFVVIAGQSRALSTEKPR